MVPDLLAEKPNYEVGSATKLSFAKKPAAVWKLDDDDEDNELINADDLLDEEDKVKPDPSNLKGNTYIFISISKDRFPRNKTICFSLWNNRKKEGMQRLLLRFG